MPIFHAQLSGQGRTPDGKIVSVHPGILLAQQGPRAQVAISLARPIANEWLQQGLTLPAPTSGHALIDTGASHTCIDDEAAQKLGLPVVDVASISSASHAATQQNVYPVLLEILGGQVVIESVRAIGGPLKAQGLLALIGRDVLRMCTLHYNGVVGQFTLAL